MQQAAALVAAFVALIAVDERDVVELERGAIPHVKKAGRAAARERRAARRRVAEEGSHREVAREEQLLRAAHVVHDLHDERLTERQRKDERAQPPAEGCLLGPARRRQRRGRPRRERRRKRRAHGGRPHRERRRERRAAVTEPPSQAQHMTIDEKSLSSKPPHQLGSL